MSSWKPPARSLSSSSDLRLVGLRALVDGLGDRSACSGTIAGTIVLFGEFVDVESAPDLRIELPPLRIEPEKAAFSDCCSVTYLEMFTDEIENSTMNSAISSVIMSE